MKRLLRGLRLPPVWQRDLHVVMALRYPATTPLTRFTRQVRLLERLGRIVSLEAVRRGDLGRLNFVVLLEQPSANAPRLAEWLRRRAMAGAVVVGDEVLGSVAAPGTAELRRRAYEGMTLVSASGPAGERIDRASVMSGAARAHEALSALGVPPRDYLVRWSPDAGLAVDLMETLRARGYGCALWPAQRATLVRSVHATRVVNLTWFDAPASVAGLVRMLGTALRASAEGVLAWLPPVDPAAPAAIEAGGSVARVLAFENIMRESRPYASDPGFYEYLFTRNPDRGDRVDYYALSAAGRVMAIGYNVHTRFSIDGQTVPGVYWGSWRKLPGVAGGSGFLLLKALSDEPVVGAYHPSSSAREALRSRTWKRVAVTTCTMRGQDLGRAAGSPRGQVHASAVYPDAMDPILAALSAAVRFTIARSPAWCRWRFDEYPLASVRYFVSDAGTAHASYFVTLRRGSVLSVADFWAPSRDAFVSLCGHLAAYCQDEGIDVVHVETSRADLVDWMRRVPGTTVTEAHNYYHFHVARSRSGPLRALLDEWDTVTVHETQASGDVLQR